ncbi:DUF2235 domain-containing protein [Flavobacterium psychrophilum]|nr:DUF2235 domain-containing protein [Flavobacterium psychrophilum]
MKDRYVNGKTKFTSDGKISFFSEGSINMNAKNIYQKGDKNGLIHGENPDKFKTEEKEKTEDDAINVYVGMFFDGTGNNMDNSDTVYYKKLNNGKINASDIANLTPLKVKVDGKEKTIDISDRDSYWNPYSNVAKLFQLYKEKKEDKKDERFPEFGKHFILKQYVEGIGTKKDEPDDFLGSGLARNSWGILARVEEGIEKAVKEQISKAVSGKKINKIVFDVFGFSRGAAAARHFCNEVKKKAKYTSEMIIDPYDPKGRIASGKQIVTTHAGGYLGKQLSKANVKSKGETYEIEIRFLGLFDTVVSDMIIKDNLGYKAGGILTFINPVIGVATATAQYSLEDIKTKLSGLGIKKTFHIVALDEWRENFASTPADEGYTLFLPGAHSDIGGGYAELDKYEAIVDFFDLKVGDQTTMQEKQKVRQFYINSRFSNEKEIKIENTYDHYKKTVFYDVDGFTNETSIEVKTKPDFKHDNNAPQVYDARTGPLIMNKISDHYIIKDTRYISNKYSLVGLNLMLEKAIQTNVPFSKNVEEAKGNGLKVTQEKEYDFPEDKTLKDYLELFKTVVKEEKGVTVQIPSEMFTTIRNKYIHLSSHYGGLKNTLLEVKAGEHHWLDNLGFVNRPVNYTLEEGFVSYKRGTYANK